jgi:hypothetical protein
MLRALSSRELPPMKLAAGEWLSTQTSRPHIHFQVIIQTYNLLIFRMVCDDYYNIFFYFDWC